ncbi:polysaccharide pyruvyl transferase WcaK-like protein [Methanomicrobium sp. W14]|uniref:polysaccharide pyruvyl transferase family protein n=1 Tax=Methanomicrobium sp. W14 TaxID=2817839 RepID=UPI001AE158FB|nr:polysaccharide pyruvyl transferase family protein [Methanomicrobium sp. W14]MBP2133098.1 polysaccharide pyruvyl transferase WcaK-like protein [Methanomicrobium sp. W14]
MIKILATGVKIEDNFGSPCILHGLQEILNELYGNQYELVYYQTTPFNEISSCDFNFKVKYIPFSGKEITLSFFTSKDLRVLIHEIKSSDIVVDLLGICFSDNFDRKRYSYFKMLIQVIYLYRFIVLAKLCGKKTVKNTCSFGPMKCKINQKSAAFACKHLFNVVSAREIKSREALVNDAKVGKKIFLSPDIANVMNYSRDNLNKNLVGVSTSHQIIRQWDGPENYVDCITNLCRHISKKYNISIILIPNEVQKMTDFNDISVSLEIKDKLEIEGINVEITDSAHISSNALKNIIASCEVIIASRYHSCVAALSSGTPTLVIGWHYKYEELLHWYGQDEWGIPTSECSSDKLISTFDSFWENRFESKKVIAEKLPEVRRAVLETGKILFSK